MAKRPSGQPVRSAERLLDVLAAFTADEPVMTSSALSRKVGLAPTTVRRLLAALERHGFVRSDDEGYRPSYELIRLAEVARHRDVLVDARFVLKHLQEVTGETIEFCVPSGTGVIVVDGVESQASLRVTVARGAAEPAWRAGAAGSALWAWSGATESDLDAAGIGSVATASGTVDEWRRFVETWAPVRARGYAIDEGQRSPGVWSVAAPVRDDSGTPVAAVQISVPQSRAARTTQSDLAVLLLRSAEDMSGGPQAGE